MKFLSSQNRGFSLAEIAVVGSIIAIIAAVIMTGALEARKDSRDAQRLADIQQLQLSLRLYKDAHGRYPAKGCGAPVGNWTGPDAGAGGGSYTSCDDYIADLVPEYISELPTDPKSEAGNLGYLYFTNPLGSQYKVLLRPIEGRTVPKGQPFARCDGSCASSPSCDVTTTFAIYSPGYKCL